MIILWLGTLLLIRNVAQMIFHRLSVHRGIWHSLLAAFFCAFSTAVVYKTLLGRHEGVAWLAGGFLFIGYLTHLVLDEIYSVDVMDTRIKASFGTALKLIDPRHLGATTAMAVATVIAFLLTPPMTTFVEGISSRALWSELQHRLLPRGAWFGVDWHRLARLPAPSSGQAPAAASAGTGSIETGSIVPSSAPPEPAESK
jgi:hypothetical protein